MTEEPKKERFVVALHECEEPRRRRVYCVLTETRAQAEREALRFCQEMSDRPLEVCEVHTDPFSVDLFTVALYDEDGRCKVYNAVAENQDQAEHEALVFYKKTYPGRTYSLVDPSAIRMPS